MKTALASLVAIIFVTAFQSAYAQGPTSNPASRQHYSPANQILDPRETIQLGVRRLKAFIASDALSEPALVNIFLEQEIAPFFDFTAMSQSILGPLNYRINEQQRQGVTAMIRKAFLAALASNLASYRGGKVDYLKISGSPVRGKVSVRLAIYQPSRYPTIVELRFARGPDGWKILDVAANGVSAVAHYRNYVRSVVQRSGVEGLLQ